MFLGWVRPQLHVSTVIPCGPLYLRRPFQDQKRHRRCYLPSRLVSQQKPPFGEAPACLRDPTGLTRLEGVSGLNPLGVGYPTTTRLTCCKRHDLFNVSAARLGNNMARPLIQRPKPKESNRIQARVAISAALSRAPSRSPALVVDARGVLGRPPRWTALRFLRPRERVHCRSHVTRPAW